MKKGRTMFTQRQYRTLIRYLLALLLVVFFAGCGGGGSDSGTPANETPGGNETPPVNETPPGNETPPTTGTPPVATIIVENIARPGPLVAVRVGETAKLDGSKSRTSSQEPLTYAWSIAFKPDGSSTELQEATTASPSFYADVRGTYMVQLVVSAVGVSSQRAIAIVEVTNSNERPTGPFNHQGLSSNCVNCHNGATVKGNGELLVAKSPDHIATTNVCQACHSTFEFNISPFVDHQEVFGNCSECHNGVLAIGKSEWHVPTTAECDDCHNTTRFLELAADGTYDHSGITRVCASCHNGITATGKDEGHIATNSECGFCHTTVDFSTAIFDHSTITGDCATCHNGIEATGQTANHPVTTADCGVCHNTQSFNLGGVFNHAVIDSVTQPCASCHNGTNATGEPAQNHPNPNNADCAMCHNPRDFADAFVDHTGFVDNCVSCHNGTDAIGLSENHIPTTADCSVCHTPGTFTSGTFDHAGVVDNCVLCHDNVVGAGMPPNHVPTPEDCAVCHSTDTFAGATIDHTNIIDGCAICHDGDSATGKAAAKPNHIPTLDDCSSCHGVSTFAPSTFLAGVHAGITNDCQSCHGDFATDKPKRTHIPTQGDCSTCHVTSSFAGATFDHKDIARGCEGCHNGKFTTLDDRIKGKSVDHIPTSQDCNSCHTTTDFTPSTFAHAGISGNCVSCHDGKNDVAGAIGLSANHIPTTADCSACHSAPIAGNETITFANAFVDHTSPEVVNVRCDSCHNGTAATGKNNGHVETTQDCGICHLSGGAFVPAVFDHSTLPKNTQCNSCHGVTATGKTPDHIATQEDCSVCHNTTVFAGAKFDHRGIVDNCASCHDGLTATGKVVNHVPTNSDCGACHVTTGFLPATFDHVGIVDNCQSCHDGILATGKTPNHPATNQDCGVCHTTRTFAGAVFDHTGIVDNCASCHGVTATGKSPNHVATNLDCSLCHTTATFVGGTWVHDASTANNCLTCHSPGNGATAQPARGHFVTGANVQCDACHTTDTWANQGTFDHCPDTNRNNNSCGTYPGDHRIGKTVCVDCHTNNEASPVSYPRDPRYAPACAGCHAGDFEREGDHIGGNNGTVEQNKNCGGSGCHRVNDNGF